MAGRPGPKRILWMGAAGAEELLEELRFDDDEIRAGGDRGGDDFLGWSDMDLIALPLKDMRGNHAGIPRQEDDLLQRRRPSQQILDDGRKALRGEGDNVISRHLGFLPCSALTLNQPKGD